MYVVIGVNKEMCLWEFVEDKIDDFVGDFLFVCVYCYDFCLFDVG